MQSVKLSKRNTYLILIFLIIISKFSCLNLQKNINEEEYSFKAIYHSTSQDETITLFSSLPTTITKMIIDNEEIEPVTSYTFSTTGYHTIYVLIDISESTSLYKMFYNIKNLDSIYFYKNFDTKNIQNFKWMFYGCTSLTEINMSSFDTSSLVYMERMFFDCQSLISVDLSNFDTTNLKGMEGLFIRGYSLQKINFDNINTESVTNMGSVFLDVQK